MGREWTEKQLDAIYAEGDLLVSAAAGAGKTSVLTERIARLISEGVSVDELLVVTFTNAAAAEMRSRIEERLRALAEEAADGGDEERASSLRHAAASCERANISTLHSFCLNVLRRNYHEAGVDPAFGVADSIDRELIAAKALSEVLEERFAADEKEPDPAFGALLAAVGNDTRLEKLLASLYAFAIARPDPDGWLDMAVSRYTDRFPETAKEIAEQLMKDARAELEYFFAAAGELLASTPDDAPAVRLALSADRDFMMQLILQDDYDRWVEWIPTYKPLTLRWKRDTDEAEKAPVKAYREAFKAFVAKLAPQFAHTLAEEREFAKLLAPPVRALRELCGRFAERFRELKEEAGVIDFSDMEQLTLKVLKNPCVAAEYRERFRYIFVDEYQDINPAQEAILAAVSNGNRFMVGDVKQSIYRFRQAEPAIFLEKYRSYKGEGGRRRIDLNSNFRSRTAILDAANLLFSRLMKGGSVGEIDYSDNAALVSGRAPSAGESAGSVELTLIDPEPEGEGADDALEPEAEESNAALQASCAAGRILHIMENETLTENGAPRRYRWGDFAILLRSARTAAAEWLAVFSEAGIPCVSDRGDGFYDAIEVRLFMDILRVIDNRRQDIPLLAAMRSPVFGFTEEELVHVKAEHRADSMLDSVAAAAEDPAAPSWSIKCRGLLARIDRWRGMCRLMELGEFVSAVLDETRLGEYVSALAGGEARRGNLELVAQLAIRYAGAGGGLGGFIRYFDAAREAARAPGSAPSSEDAVKLMTIHSSKGLEFPVVIIGDVTKKFNTGYKSDVGIFDARFGIGLCSVSGDRTQRSILQRAVSAREGRRLAAEEMRLLYVAQTRAKEKLIMLGVKKKAAAYAEKLAKTLNDVRIMKADTYADWMLGAYFPDGTDVPAAFPHGGSLKLGVIGASAAAGNRRGMSADELSAWRQEASFLDTAELKKRFETRYDALEDTALPSKLSVTGLTLSAAELRETPRFMEGERPLTGAEAGTLTHRLLQLISLRRHTEDSVREELSRMTEAGLFTEREAAAIRIPAIVGFFDSELGKRLLASPRVEREREFGLMMEASALTDSGSDAPIMLQGVIDCCFMEGGEWVLVDHKTTHVDSNHTPRTVAERYRRQLTLYAAALERLTGAPVKEKYVYLLSADAAVKL